MPEEYQTNGWLRYHDSRVDDGRGNRDDRVQRIDQREI